MAFFSSLGALALGALAVGSIYSANQQAKAQKEQIRMQEEALRQQQEQQKQALEMQKYQQGQSQQAMNAANKKRPGLGGLSGLFSGDNQSMPTMLTGPGGAVVEDDKLNRRSLLGG